MRKSTVGFGMLRDIDPLGRLCIPKELRNAFHFDKKIEIVVTNEGILIRNPRYVLIEKGEYERLKKAK